TIVLNNPRSSVAKNVSQLKLPDTSAIHISNQQIPAIESEIIERRIRHITNTRCKLRRIEGVEVIKPDLESIALHRCELEIDRLSQTKIEPVLSWTTQSISSRHTSPQRLTHKEPHVRRIHRIAVQIRETSRRRRTRNEILGNEIREADRVCRRIRIADHRPIVCSTAIAVQIDSTHKRRLHVSGLQPVRACNRVAAQHVVNESGSTETRKIVNERRYKPVRHVK